MILIFLTYYYVVFDLSTFPIFCLLSERYDFAMYDHLLLTEKKPVWLCCQFGSGQTLQQTPKIPGSAEIMRNRSTESIVVYL